jgi:hypothetical protein
MRTEYELAPNSASYRNRGYAAAHTGIAPARGLLSGGVYSQLTGGSLWLLSFGPLQRPTPLGGLADCLSAGRA